DARDVQALEQDGRQQDDGEDQGEHQHRVLQRQLELVQDVREVFFHGCAFSCRACRRLSPEGRPWGPGPPAANGAKGSRRTVHPTAPFDVFCGPVGYFTTSTGTFTRWRTAS